MNSPNRKRGCRIWIPSPPVVIGLLLTAPWTLGCLQHQYFDYLNKRDCSQVIDLIKKHAPPGADFSGLTVHLNVHAGRITWSWRNPDFWPRSSFPTGGELYCYRERPDLYEEKNPYFRPKEFYVNEMYEFYIRRTRDRLPDDGTLDYWDKLSKQQHISMVSELMKSYTPGKSIWNDADHTKYETELIKKLVTEFSRSVSIQDQGEDR